MSLLHCHVIFLVLFLPLLPPSLAQNSSSACPLDFGALRRFYARVAAPECQFIRQGLRLVQSLFLRGTGRFLPPANSSESCWDSYQALVSEFFPKFDIRSSCEFDTTAWAAEACLNITTKAQFEAVVPKSSLGDVARACNHSLENNSPCAFCTTRLSALQASYLAGGSNASSSSSDCTAYPSIYAAAFSNWLGPTDLGTARCLFQLDFTASDDGSHRTVVVLVAVIVSVAALVLGGCGGGIWYRIRTQKKKMGVGRVGEVDETGGFESISNRTNLIRFRFDEIKEATGNFCRGNIIGMGGYGNVYRGVMKNGSEVAVKRFKNCSAAGDASFAHEVEVIASIRHVNLVALRGFCTATVPLEGGHQRLIVCDLMKNGSLHDHLFGSRSPPPNSSNKRTMLSWPIRQNIALGTARGLAYLHHGAHPAIIHRDIKASNILLDERFEPKLGDFGLARFAPEGVTHLSTRVAGTMGYVAPEYALYGQVTERSDVYSFGVVLLELLSGKKAITPVTETQTTLVADWAWALMRRGRPLDVVDQGMPEMGGPEVMERYVLIAALCSHPQLYARPTMDQVVKILEMDLPVPLVPDRPIPIVADIGDIERSASSSGSGQLSTPAGYQPFTLSSDRDHIL